MSSTHIPMQKWAKLYTMVRRAVWTSKRFGALPGDHLRYLFLYLLTSPHQNSVGCYKLSVAYALGDLSLASGSWTAEKLAAGIAELENHGLILTDQETGEIMILQWWKDNGPSNQYWYMGARRQCDAIESAKLRAAAVEALEASWKAFLIANGMPPGPIPSRATGPSMSNEERFARFSDKPKR
jgi:hypothetical protein